MMTFLQAAEAVATSEETRMGLWTLFTKGVRENDTDLFGVVSR